MSDETTNPVVAPATEETTTPAEPTTPVEPATEAEVTA